jgi:hypothetical protein
MHTHILDKFSWQAMAYQVSNVNKGWFKQEIHGIWQRVWNVTKG